MVTLIGVTFWISTALTRIESVLPDIQQIKADIRGMRVAMEASGSPGARGIS